MMRYTSVCSLATVAVSIRACFSNFLAQKTFRICAMKTGRDALSPGCPQENTELFFITRVLPTAPSVRVHPAAPGLGSKRRSRTMERQRGEANGLPAGLVQFFFLFQSA